MSNKAKDKKNDEFYSDEFYRNLDSIIDKAIEDGIIDKAIEARRSRETIKAIETADFKFTDLGDNKCIITPNGCYRDQKIKPKKMIMDFKINDYEKYITISNKYIDFTFKVQDYPNREKTYTLSRQRDHIRRSVYINATESY